MEGKPFQIQFHADEGGQLGTRSAAAIEAAQQLKKVAIDSEEAADLIDTMLDGSVHGNGDRIVLGEWLPHSEWKKEYGGYLKEAQDNGGIYFETPPGPYDALGRNPDLAWEANKWFLETQLEAGKIIEFHGDALETLRNAPSDSCRDREIKWLLENAVDFGYEMINNTWIKVVD